MAVQLCDTPCIGVCKVEKGVCVGCNRTLEQIANWSRMTEQERLEA